MRVATLALYLTLLLCPAAWAQTFKVGVELQPYMPYSTVQDGQYLSYGRELLDAFAAHQGYAFIYQPLPVRRLLSEFLNDRVDFKYPDNSRWNADLKQGHAIHYSHTAAPAIDGVMVRPQYLGQGKQRIRRLGTQRGFTPWPYLEDIQAGTILLIQANQVESLLAMALSGRVDAVYLNPQVVAHQLRLMNQDGALVFDPGLDYLDDNYFLSSIQHPEVIEQFNAFLVSKAELVRTLQLRHGIIEQDSAELSPPAY
jgi:polar amino acid transport system substrate-binding protein